MAIPTMSGGEPEVLEQLLQRQLDMTEIQKKRKYKELYQIPVIIDDFADRAAVMHSPGNILASLFIRGRHGWISTLVSSQKLMAIATPLRVNATFICCFRLRNAKELDSLLEELTAIYPLDVLRQMHELAVKEPYSFWFINLLHKKPEDMFRIGPGKKLMVLAFQTKRMGFNVARSSHESSRGLMSFLSRMSERGLGTLRPAWYRSSSVRWC